MVVKSDPYLLDYGCVRLNCFVDQQMRLIVVKLSWNREIVEEVACNDYTTDIPAIIDDIIRDDEYMPCLGFSDQDTSGMFDVFYRLRKNDIPFILIEKYNGSLLFRARNCKFVYQRNGCDKDKNDIFSNNCENCIDIYTQMDLKYSFGRFTKSNHPTNISNNKINEILTDDTLPVGKEQISKDTLIAPEESEKVNTISELEVTKRPRRDSRHRKSGSKYKDFVVDLGITEGQDLPDNTAKANDNINEDIENIENLPLNVRNQEVRIAVSPLNTRIMICNFSLCLRYQAPTL